jgi:hypothetical protein
VAQNARDLGAAMVVIYGNDGIADLAWSRSRKQALRNDIPTPVLLISEADGEKVVSLLATEQLETQLSKKPYCDSVYKYGIPLGKDQTPAGMLYCGRRHHGVQSLHQRLHHLPAEPGRAGY